MRQASRALTRAELWRLSWMRRRTSSSWVRPSRSPADSWTFWSVCQLPSWSKPIIGGSFPCRFRQITRQITRQLGSSHYFMIKSSRPFPTGRKTGQFRRRNLNPSFYVPFLCLLHHFLLLFHLFYQLIFLFICLFRNVYGSGGGGYRFRANSGRIPFRLFSFPPCTTHRNVTPLPLITYFMYK